jgi:hypothetical protein
MITEADIVLPSRGLEHLRPQSRPSGNNEPRSGLVEPLLEAPPLANDDLELRPLVELMARVELHNSSAIVDDRLTLGRSTLQMSVACDDDPSFSGDHRDPRQVFRLRPHRTGNPLIAVGTGPARIARVGDV